MRQLSLALAVFLAATQAALGHGGTYRNPDPRTGDTCSPGRARTLTGGGSGGTTGGRSSTTLRTPRQGTDLTHAWDWWWEHNGDRYLEARAKAARDLATPSASTGRSRTARSSSAQLAELIRDQIRSAALPALRAGLTDPYFDARAASAIALGKVVDRTMPEADEVRRALRDLLADPEHEVAESACLGLGLLGDKSDAPDLVLLMKDQPSVRGLAGSPAERVRLGQRAFAAVGAGLVGMRNHLADSVVFEMVECAKNEAHLDVRVIATVALGPMRSRYPLPELRKLVASPGTDPATRAHAIVALAKLSDPGFMGWLLRAGLEDQDSAVQRSSAIAVGLLSPREDERAVDALIKRAQWATDRPVRNFALIALGQIGSPRACRFLLDRIRSSQTHDKTFGALALGLCGARSKDRKEEIGDALLREWTEAKVDLERGAIAIGLGLLGWEPAIPALSAELRSPGATELKGHVATALALLGAHEAAPQIRVLATDLSDADAQARARKALGLLGDAGDVGVLLEAIRSPGVDASATGAAAVGLGFIGRKDAVPALCDMLTRRGVHKDATRAFAAVALGCLGDKDPLPLLTSVRADSNYLATTDGFRELARIY